VDTLGPLPRHPDLMTPGELSEWVHGLVDCQVEEGLRLDYKEGAYDLAERKDKAELAKDATSFANTLGGVILVGLPEKRDAQGRKTGLPQPDYGMQQQHDYDSRASRAVQ